MGNCQWLYTNLNTNLKYGNLFQCLPLGSGNVMMEKVILYFPLGTLSFPIQMINRIIQDYLFPNLPRHRSKHFL